MGGQPPMDPSMMGGQPPMDPSMGGGQPMPPQGAPPPEMAGGMGGMPAGGMDPMAQGGMPQGMDPMAAQQQQAPMGATMNTEEPSATEIQNQMNPQFLEQAGALQDADVFDAAAIASMSRSPSFQSMVTDYVPTLERALDNLGRILLSMWMQEAELRENIGEEEYGDLEDNIRAVFDGLGRLILSMNKNAIVLSN